MSSDWAVTFPTLGDLAAAWVERHCRIPDMWRRGDPFVWTDWQFWCAANWYRVREDATYDADRPPLNQAFRFRRALVIGPQKSGKGPWSASMTAVEAAGPSQFAGWAGEDDAYRCSEHGCGCGWEYPYLPGEPMGQRHPSPVIQITATSEDQTDNIYRPLRAMIDLGPLKELMAVREGFIRILGSSSDEDFDRIDVVTSSANSRLGNPISFAPQDETGLWVKSNKMVKVAETQRRNAAGMGGRTMETTNCFDPSEASVAQRTMEAAADDVFIFYDPPPAHLSYKNKRERRQIHKYNYRHSPWVTVDSIDAEAAEIAANDPAQAERFFGNRIVADYDSYFDADAWEQIASPGLVPDGAMIALGFDGSMYDDWTAIRARWVTEDGMYGFTPTFADGAATVWNPADFGGEVPRGEVHAAVSELFARFTVVRMYCDPELWQSEIDGWAAEFGEKIVVAWPTNRTRPMSEALERLRTDITTKAFTHDGDVAALLAVRNARRVRRPGGIVIGKPNDHQKIDVVMADTLAHEAACDAKAAGLTKPRRRGIIVM
jgi:hypothetical protein